MREAMKPVWFILKVSIIIAIAAYPITFIVQIFSTTSNPFTLYNQTIAFIFSNYWDWIIIGVLSILFMRSDLLFKSIEHIRLRHYELEFLRWRDTPFISPLHLLYLLSPPGAITDDKMSNAFDPFYKTVITDFRDRVYINAKFIRFEPENKPTILAVLGRQLISQFAVNSFMILAGVVGVLFLNPVTSLFDGWGKVVIPFEILFLSRNFQIMRAVRLAHPSKTYDRVKRQFDQEEPKVTWRELYPDSPLGEAILFAWKADCEKRQRLAYELSNKPVPTKMDYQSAGLAPKPFPSEEIPEWADEAARSLKDQQSQWRAQIDKQNRELEKATDGKVVAFRKRGG